VDNSFPEHGAGTQQDTKSFLVSLPIIDSTIQWLASLIKLTAEEVESAGIYLGRLGGE